MKSTSVPQLWKGTRSPFMIWFHQLALINGLKDYVNMRLTFRQIKINESCWPDFRRGIAGESCIRRRQCLDLYGKFLVLTRLEIHCFRGGAFAKVLWYEGRDRKKICSIPFQNNRMLTLPMARTLMRRLIRLATCYWGDSRKCLLWGCVSAKRCFS